MPLRALLLLLATLTSSACAAEPQVFGPYKLTESDVREIKALVAAHPEIHKPINYIYANYPNRAHVDTGTIRTRKDVGSIFAVAKRGGKWRIDSPIEDERLIIGGY